MGYAGFEVYNAVVQEKDGTNKNVGNYLVYPADAFKGYHFGYIIYIPREVREDSVPLVEGANTGKPSNTIQEGIASVQNSIYTFSSVGQRIAYQMHLPCMIPLFPRVTINGHELYTHMLTSEVLNIEEGPFKRIDMQLVNMIEDAKERLYEMNIHVDEKVIVDGFSASSKFMNRFSLLCTPLLLKCA